MIRHKLIIISLLMGFIIGVAVSSLRTPSQEKSVNPQIQIVKEKVIVKECPQNPAEEILPPPALSPSLKPPLASNHEGEVKISWSEVPFADRYRIKVLNQKGQLVKSYSTPRSILYIKELPYDENLPFTLYTIILSTINKNNLEGASGPSYELRVRPLKNLVAPVINDISIEN